MALQVGSVAADKKKHNSNMALDISTSLSMDCVVNCKWSELTITISRANKHKLTHLPGRGYIACFQWITAFLVIMGEGHGSHQATEEPEDDDSKRC